MSTCISAFVKSCAPASGKSSSEVRARRGIGAGAGAVSERSARRPGAAHRERHDARRGEDEPQRRAEHAGASAPHEPVADAEEPDRAQHGERHVERGLLRELGPPVEERR